MRVVSVVLGLCLVTSAARSAELPCAQVRIIVPFPPGGAADVGARLIGERLEPLLKKPVIVENRAGATGNIGMAALAAAPPDGCTLAHNAAVVATFTASFSKLSYDPINDLVPIGGAGITPTLRTLEVRAPNRQAERVRATIFWWIPRNWRTWSFTRRAQATSRRSCARLKRASP